MSLVILRKLPPDAIGVRTYHVFPSDMPDDPCDDWSITMKEDDHAKDNTITNPPRTAP
jgi:hypothetical protein